MGENPAVVIQNGWAKGFESCTLEQVQRSLAKPSSSPGAVVIFPTTGGHRLVYEVQPDGNFKPLSEQEFDFLERAGRWSVAMVRPKRKSKV